MNKNESALLSMSKQQWNETESLWVFVKISNDFYKLSQVFRWFYFHYYLFMCSSIFLIILWEKNCWNTSETKKKFLQYLWSDSQKTIPEISWEQCSHKRFPTNFTEQHNLNSSNLFPNSKPLRYVSYHKSLVVLCRNCEVK